MSLQAQADGVERIAALEHRARVLDLCCGGGRRAIELARRGHRVLGVDPDAAALAEARAAARGERLNVHFLKADPGAIPYRAEFDAVVWCDGSFGRTPDERDDLRALDGARRALKPGGRLLLDVPNRERWLRAAEAGGDSFDLEAGRLGPGSSCPGARLYALSELIALVERAGLAYRRSWGGFDGSAYRLDSPRLVLLAVRSRDERPARRGAADGFPTAIRIKGRR